MIAEGLGKIILEELKRGEGWVWWVTDITGRVVGRCKSIKYSKLDTCRENAEMVLGVEIILIKQGGIYTDAVIHGRTIDAEVRRVPG